MITEFFALDIETTGLNNVMNGGHITQIAVSKYDVGTMEVSVVFDRIIHSDSKVVPYEIEVLTGISTVMLRNSQHRLRETLLDLMSMIKGKYVVIHNANFDSAHINLAMMLFTLNVISDYAHIYCSLQYFRKMDIPNGNKLENLVSHYGIDVQGYHNAAVDTMALCKLIAKVGVDDFFQPKNAFQN
jgi:DNA polymerase III subunit epsilon